ncbi:TIGR04141 family sporadically distributed protein [Streptomyces griseiscabiei]|uniref:TIGR04141 family sporadically distributed protein n=1 Tax=Streptomyces griseiscabiei TaxID=2993540 RepID=A0ABU4L979_9ACTN|nr:TIGR04141 family sporadically distributed protein [Streptomyces griseiscabiei]MDX2911709.1 TIGR04141 family sporadically distributed protein [Streptomyces griseiscabiei]
MAPEGNGLAGIDHDEVGPTPDDQCPGPPAGVRARVGPGSDQGLVPHTPGGGRTDMTLIPGGASVWSLGIAEHAQIVRRLGGPLDDIPLTISRDNPTKVTSPEGGAGLRLRLGVESTDLIADICAVARVLREDKPSPEPEFVEHAVPLDDPGLLTRLEAILDDLLGQEPAGRTTVAVPADHWDDYEAAQAFRARVNSDAAGRSTDDFDLGYVLCRASVQRAGSRVAALREGTVILYRHGRADRADEIRTSSALRWIEAAVSLASHRFFLMDDHWYEIDQEYLKTIRSHADRLITDSPSVDLPRGSRCRPHRSPEAHRGRSHPSLARCSSAVTQPGRDAYARTERRQEIAPRGAAGSRISKITPSWLPSQGRKANQARC